MCSNGSRQPLSLSVPALSKIGDALGQGRSWTRCRRAPPLGGHLYPRQLTDLMQREDLSGRWTWIPRFRLFGWLHRQAHGRDSRTASVMRASRYSFPLDADPRRCLQARCQSPFFAIFESAAEVRVLPSTGMTRLQRSYVPVPLPPNAVRPLNC